ncbi:MAG: methyltransferase domain-containing protein [Candidatus Omnitrophota bacterium]|nr:MAG: methyltransferase domain-containing protein [Candidatus Omnitrophota bacterium]
MPEDTAQLKIWTGKFGREYTNRNTLSPDKLEKLYRDNYGITRTALNKMFLDKLDRSMRILEVGSNIGLQLVCLQRMGFKNLYGIESQDYAVELCKKNTRNIKIIKGNALNLPFKDGYFDLVFTSGVLIHINPRDIRKAMKEIHRSSNKYIWGFEYYSKKYEEIIYREKKNLLWKADFQKLYLESFSDLRLIKKKRLKYLKNQNVDMMFLLKKGK